MWWYVVLYSDELSQAVQRIARGIEPLHAPYYSLESLSWGVGGVATPSYTWNTVKARCGDTVSSPSAIDYRYGWPWSF
jgi:hypothetical protein